MLIEFSQSLILLTHLKCLNVPYPSIFTNFCMNYYAHVPCGVKIAKNPSAYWNHLNIHSYTKAGFNYTKLYQLQLHFFFSITITHIIFQINYNYTVSFTITITLSGTKMYSAFVNYVFLHILLNFNILYTIDRQI